MTFPSSSEWISLGKLNPKDGKCLVHIPNIDNSNAYTILISLEPIMNLVVDIFKTCCKTIHKEI